MNLPNSAGVMGIGTPPTSASRALIFASARRIDFLVEVVDHFGRRARRCAHPWRLTSNSAKVNVASDEPDTLVIIGESLRHALSESAENDEEEFYRSTKNCGVELQSKTTRRGLEDLTQWVV
jgi:hypothetical protein